MSALAATIALVFSVGAGADTVAQEQGCGVGTRVEFEDGARGVGTIKEIGTESPHVGWYRIVFSWNSPNGDWYSPKNWGILIAGTKTKCGQESARGKQEPQNSGDESRPGRKAGAGVPEQAGCPMTEPPGKVTKTSPASAQLFKRVIYERAAAEINPASISAPKKIGLTFLEFNMGEPYKNTLTSSRFGDKRRHDGAPEGAMIYPIKTKELQCDLHGDAIRRSVTEVSHNCFKNRSGEWTCPGRTTRTVESRLIPRE
ncbi:MAG TPA: hypothetical protein VJ864_12070 [Candidatus Binatia bacterium]|nr:hypothetical protein [Candidatus Binatia bacterium]